VEPYSAFIGHAFERKGTVHTDHIGLTMFESEEDNGFQLVSNAIKDLIEESNTKHSTADKYRM
jgi:hypothetical protein